MAQHGVDRVFFVVLVDTGGGRSRVGGVFPHPPQAGVRVPGTDTSEGGHEMHQFWHAHAWHLEQCRIRAQARSTDDGGADRDMEMQKKMMRNQEEREAASLVGISYGNVLSGGMSS